MNTATTDGTGGYWHPGPLTIDCGDKTVWSWPDNGTSIERPKFNFHDEGGYVEVGGVNYDYSLFKEFGVFGMEEGQLFRFESRNDGVIVITRISTPA